MWQSPCFPGGACTDACVKQPPHHSNQHHRFVFRASIDGSLVFVRRNKLCQKRRRRGTLDVLKIVGQKFMGWCKQRHNLLASQQHNYPFPSCDLLVFGPPFDSSSSEKQFANGGRHASFHTNVGCHAQEDIEPIAESERALLGS